MANRNLFYSSLLFGFVHLLYLVTYPTSIGFRFILISGILSSIWNHGDTNPIAKWLDRSIMVIGVVTDSLVLSSSTSALQPVAHGLFVAACVSYGVSKVNPDRLTSDMQHICAHCFLTIAHCCLIVSST